jgi:UDP:flavonoid glycosyltransferase YjiC (YdhE family)
MRLLVVSWPGYGHLLPMVPLIRAARARGVEVVVSTGADLGPTAERLGVRVHQSGLTLAESYARVPARLGDLPPAEELAFAAQHFFGGCAVDRGRDVAALLERWRPDLVVHDTLELGGAAAAEVHGVPHLTHGYGPTVPGTAVMARIAGGAVAAGGLPDPVPAILAAPYLDPCPPSLRGPEPTPWTDVRPVRATSGDPGEPVVLPEGPLVYVTLGTVTNQAPEVFRAVLAGCLRLPVGLVVTTGPDVDPATLGPLPPRVLAARFLPQARVLAQSVAVVSHGGAGTMLGAVCHGLPQLCLPQGTDQPANATALVASGAGLRLDPGEVTAEAVETAVRRLLDERAFREAATLLAAEVGATPSAGTVLDTLTAELVGATAQ